MMRGPGGRRLEMKGLNGCRAPPPIQAPGKILEYASGYLYSDNLECMEEKDDIKETKCIL